MSRREDRDSYARRTRFRPEREPSPKRSRRDRERGERHPIERSYYPKNRNFHEYKGRETERMMDSRRPIDDSKAGSESKNERASDPKQFARSKFYFQHDDQGKPGGPVRIRHETENGRSDLKESKSDEKIKEKKNDESAWTHDRYLEQADDSKPMNKRASFTENKIKEPEFSSLNASKKEEIKPYYRFEKRGNDRFERRGEGFGRGNRNENRRNGAENRRGNGASNRRGNGNLGFRGRVPIGGREGFEGARIGDGNWRNGSMGNEVQNEKWKHDMYEELNKKNPANEEEQISKIEALLAS